MLCRGLVVAFVHLFSRTSWHFVINYIFISLSTFAESLRRNGRKPKSVINVDLALMALLNQPLVEEERVAAHDFFLTLAACNTVIPVSTESLDLTNEVNETGSIDYQGESPDEQALVCAASAYGYTLVERTTGHIVIDVQGVRIR
jgi:phospholipid-transporting ATPase